ncbi:hypothetical protein SAMN05660489_04872 [Pseudomonas sp. LAMO17WK12:I10]|uniref:hypothetical protein n=1 Tax=unclassified Pseudomonas TaxID=196821 RepID=UPI000BD68205|nr:MULTISPECIES: hypothetical protein [unclassified Pseudomonas]PXX59076.1 hypothetical protein H160_04805 [Pseudomonas sp. LAMO17WK12:I9]SNY48397.1 hypothetical protein SAMN05660489_04872 [Pseudomonas sp. LAMO17WK12:I10]
MSKNDALFPIVKNYIEFESLLVQAMRAIEAYSSTSWSNTDEHDPGITLLQALCYNTSDVAYRTSLPLTDLLTPAPQDQKDDGGIFPTEFGPQRALTCGPVSVDDYRRALLDLTWADGAGAYFCFDNVYLVREPEEARYHYWYNVDQRVYSFVEPEEDDSIEMSLLGNCFLYLQATRESEMNKQPAQAVLDAYLRDHRNLGEAISRIIWLVPKDVMVKMEIELQDNVDASTSFAAILADIYTVTNRYITPPVNRYSTQELQDQGFNNEQIYQGPYLLNGWIPQLPPALDYEQPATVNLARLVNGLLAIDGVKNIRTLGTEQSTTDNPWEWTADAAGGYPRLWGADPIAELASDTVVRLIAHGIDCTATIKEIEDHLTIVPKVLNPPVTLPYGRWRNPAVYHPVTDKLPPCYGLLQLPATPSQIQFHQFILPFEQLLANGCKQLELLPNLLAFDRAKNDIVWGEQWPFTEPSISDFIFRDYSPAIKNYLQECSADMDKELSYIDYLLGYFNGKVAPRVFTIAPSLFMESQQGYLSENTKLTYQRANIRIDKVSALQQRIAARLGIGGAEIFNENAPLDKLPFYIVEHRALLPVYPDPSYNDLQIPEELESDGDYLTVVMPETSVAPLKVGQLINFILAKDGIEQTIRALMIARVNSDEHSFSVGITTNAELQRNLAEILDPANTVQWQNCPVWLEDMNYPLVYDADQSGLLSSDQRRLTSSPQSPYPAMVQEEDELTIKYRISADLPTDAPNTTTELKVKVVKADNIASTLVVEKLSGGEFPAADRTRGYFWYFDSESHATRDRFSFIVSVVFERDQLNQLTSDINATNAWMRNTILEEFPSYISMMMHWLPDDQFKNFAYTYNTWQNSGAPLGDASYSLMRMLTLGCIPSSLTGIGAMHIATDEQRSQVVGENDDEWNSSVIVEDELFYVPPNALDSE